MRSVFSLNPYGTVVCKGERGSLTRLWSSDEAIDTRGHNSCLGSLPVGCECLPEIWTLL